jgi:hypothetical protein
MGGYAESLLAQSGSQSAGNAQINVATVTLTSPQLLGMKAAPVQLLPAPGAGKAYCVLATLSNYRFKTTPYTLGAGSDLYIQPIAPGSSGLFFVAVNAGFLDQAADTMILGFGEGLAQDLALYEDRPLTITEQAPAAMTLGDGEVTITMYYAIIDLNAR